MATYKRTNLDRTTQALSYVQMVTGVSNSLYMCFYKGDSSDPTDPQLLPANPETLTVTDVIDPKFYIKVGSGVSSDGYIKLIKEDSVNGTISYYGKMYRIVEESNAFSENVNLVYIRVKITPSSISYNEDIRGYCLILNPQTNDIGSPLATSDSYIDTEINQSTGQLLFINNVTKYTRIPTSGEFVEIILPF